MFEIIKKTPYLRLVTFFVAFVWFIRFSGTVLPVYFLQSGLSFPQMAWGITLSIIGQIVGIFILSRAHAHSRLIWRAAIVAYVCAFILYVVAPVSIFYYFGTFISGIGSIFFYGAYNVHMFSLLPRDKTGTASSHFFNLLVLIGIVAPIFSAVVAHWSIYMLLGLSFVCAAIAMYFAHIPQTQPITFSIGTALTEIRRVRVPIFLHGIHEAMSYIIPILTLSLLSNFFEFGAFGTVIALVGVVFSHYVGKISDKLSSKKKLLTVFAWSLAAVTSMYAIPVVRTHIIFWTIINIANNFIDQLYDQTSLAFIMDETKSRVDAIFGRELVMNVGRTVGMLVAFLGFAVPVFLPYAIILLACAMAGFALFVSRMQTQKS